METGFNCGSCIHYYECLELQWMSGNPKCFGKSGHPYYENRFEVNPNDSYKKLWEDDEE